jgi:hypothetical protein
LPERLDIGSELAEDINNAGSRKNCTHQDSQGYYIALVLPIGNVTGRATAAKEGMGIHSITVTAGSCHRFEHRLILACCLAAEIDPHQYPLPDTTFRKTIDIV